MGVITTDQLQTALERSRNYTDSLNTEGVNNLYSDLPSMIAEILSGQNPEVDLSETVIGELEERVAFLEEMIENL